MAKLNQIIAVEEGVKSKAHQDLTAAHHGLQKRYWTTVKFSGPSRSGASTRSSTASRNCGRP
ncbi:hypothetical protein [Streptomyces sp. NPDC001843]|uniref:DUF7873 family protein n=1 Tax=Streptomyces sp. NPDC001843 TaxID=3364617 RepID=UPI0036B47E96